MPIKPAMIRIRPSQRRFWTALLWIVLIVYLVLGVAALFVHVELRNSLGSFILSTLLGLWLSDKIELRWEGKQKNEETDST